MISASTFDQQLDELRWELIATAAHVSESVSAATRALLDRDEVMVARVRDAASHVNAAVVAVDQRVFELLALHTPMATDLRALRASLRMTQEFELSSNLMMTVTKAAARLAHTELHPRIRGLIEQMGTQGGKQFRLAVDAFADADVELAGTLASLDDEMDDLQKELFQAIFDTSTNNHAGIEVAVELALIGRYYERFADHAVQVGHWVEFILTGSLPSPQKPLNPTG